MTQAEQNEARIRLKAVLRQRQLEHNRGLCSAAQLAEAQERLRAVVEHRPDGKPMEQAAPKRTERPWVPDGEELNPATAALIETLRAEFSAIDLQKAERCNALQDIPEDRPATAELAAIMSLRGALMEKKDQIDYVLLHGVLPSSAPVEEQAEGNLAAWREKLPSDKVAINRMLLNERTNLSKYRDRAKKAETPAKKQHYAVQVAKAERRMAALQEVLNS